jgi:hypoxanthine phosphoribosyltransferase
MDKRILISESEISKRTDDIAKAISEEYSGKEVDFICLINSASFFYVDIVRKMTIPVKIHFLGFSSYNSSNDTGEIRITHDIQEPLNNKHVIIFEGIVVSGRTPKYVFDYIKLRKPTSLEYCAVGVKPAALAVDLKVKYYGFEFEPDIIVGGYGIGKGIEKGLPYLIAL